MPARTKSVATTLPQDELVALDRVRERQQLTRSQALREAVRWYVGVMRRLPPAEEALPDEIDAIRRGKEEIARGECVLLEDVLHELDRR